MIPWRIGLITPVYFAVIFIIKLKEREGREVIFKMLSSISNWFPNRWFYVIIIPPAWPMKLPIIYTQIWCGRGVGTLVAIWGYSVEKNEVTQWNALLDIHAILQTGSLAAVTISLDLMLQGKGTGFWVSSGDHSAVSPKLKNSSAGTHLRVANAKKCRRTLIP